MRSQPANKGQNVIIARLALTRRTKLLNVHLIPYKFAYSDRGRKTGILGQSLNVRNWGDCSRRHHKLTMLTGSAGERAPPVSSFNSTPVSPRVRASRINHAIRSAAVA